MLTKILLVAIFVLLSWNSFHLTKSNEFLHVQVKQLIGNDESIETLILSNETLLKGHSKTLIKNSELSLSNQESLNQMLAKDKKGATLKSIKETVDKMQKSVSKQTGILSENKKTLAGIKKTLAENKKTIVEVKKVSYRISDQVKKHSHSSTTNNVVKNRPVTTSKKPVYIKKTESKAKINNAIKKVIVVKEPLAKKPLIAETGPFKQLAIEFYKTKELHQKKNMKEALSQLEKLKTEVWKSRKFKNISTKLVMSILSSIDITKKKWTNKEENYNLSKVEEKLNTLYSKLGFYK